MSELNFKTIAELTAMLTAGETTSVAITQAVIDRIAEVEEKVKAFIATMQRMHLHSEQASDARRAADKQLGPLDGIPVGIKDILAVKDGRWAVLPRCWRTSIALRRHLYRQAPRGGCRHLRTFEYG